MKRNLNLIEFGLTKKKFLIDEESKAYSEGEIFKCSILLQILVRKVIQIEDYAGSVSELQMLQLSI